MCILGWDCQEIASETNMRQRTRCTGNASLFVAFAIISAQFLPGENWAKLAVNILNQRFRTILTSLFMIWKVFIGAVEIVADKNYSQQSFAWVMVENNFLPQEIWFHKHFTSLIHGTQCDRSISSNGFSMERFSSSNWIITQVNIKNKQTHHIPRVNTCVQHHFLFTHFSFTLWCFFFSHLKKALGFLRH